MSSLSIQVRRLFEMPPERDGRAIVELRSLTHGIPPKAIRKNLDAFFEEWRQNGVDAWNRTTISRNIFLVGDEAPADRDREIGWWNLPEIVGDRFISRLLNAPKETCIMLSNATQIVFGILSCRELNMHGRRKVICTDGEFPAVLHTIRNYNRQFSEYPEAIREAVQLDITVVEMGNSAFDERKIIKHIDDKTALVIFSHIGFIRGERVPDTVIHDIAKACHRHGALIAIDGYHAIGSHHINVATLDVDFYFGGLLKEGCGSSGNCFLYVRKELDVHPSLSGWFADKYPFAFAETPEAHDCVRRRFLTGTIAIAPIYHGLEGLKIMLQFGLENVAVDILLKVETIVSILTKNGIRVISPMEKERMSAMVVVEVEEANKLREHLKNEYGILTDARKNTYLRLAPNIYNSLDEVSYAANQIAESCINKRYKLIVHKEVNGPVT